MDNFKLCYIKEPWAFFTTQDLSEQWGDDWNDAPYEHNAGRPYEPCWHREGGKSCNCKVCKGDWNKDGSPKWEILQIAYEADLEPPGGGRYNARYSVKSINAGAVAWLRTSEYHTGAVVAIPAGVTLRRFVELVESVDGRVFLPRNDAPRLLAYLNKSNAKGR